MITEGWTKVILIGRGFLTLFYFIAKFSACSLVKTDGKWVSEVRGVSGVLLPSPTGAANLNNCLLYTSDAADE